MVTSGLIRKIATNIWRDVAQGENCIPKNSDLNYQKNWKKSAISKVQKSIICIFKNSKKSIFAPESF